MILLIDNYDSFVFNLARYFRELNCEVAVVRNDAMSVDEIAEMQPEAIVLSPGPCTPNEAGICLQVVTQLGEKIPMLGVCLGHQTIAAALGGDVVRAPEPVHGRVSLVEHNGDRIFAGLPNPLTATRYHSLVVPETTLPTCLRVTARTRSADKLVMGLDHTKWPMFGLQFHPESVLTSGGHRLLQNFLVAAGLRSESQRASPENDVDRLDSLEHGQLRVASDEATSPDQVSDVAGDWHRFGPIHW